MNQNESQADRLPDPQIPDQEEHKPYEPRPKWQVVMAWVLLGIVILGVLNICYWEIFS